MVIEYKPVDNHGLMLFLNSDSTRAYLITSISIFSFMAY
jgi:hypothetical protein